MIQCLFWSLRPSGFPKRETIGNTHRVPIVRQACCNLPRNIRNFARRWSCAQRTSSAPAATRDSSWHRSQVFAWRRIAPLDQATNAGPDLVAGVTRLTYYLTPISSSPLLLGTRCKSSCSKWDLLAFPARRCTPDRTQCDECNRGYFLTSDRGCRAFSCHISDSGCKACRSLEHRTADGQCSECHEGFFLDQARGKGWQGGARAVSRTGKEA